MGKLVPKIILITLFLSLFLGLVVNEPSKVGSPNDMLYPASTTDPGNPVILTDDSSDAEFYPTGTTSYYYKTFALTSSYGIIWVRPLGSYNIDLYIYTDSGYSTLLDSSNTGVGVLQWVVIKKGGETDYYPRAYVASASGASVYIEYDSGLYCSFGAVKSNDHLKDTDAVEIYYLSLASTQSYDFRLTVPATGDYDLYLYNVESSITADPTEYLNKSTTTGVGVDESITNFAAPLSGTYIVLIVWVSGDGTFQFTYNFTEQTGGGIPGFELIYLLFGLVMVSITQIHLRNKSHLTNTI